MIEIPPEKISKWEELKVFFKNRFTSPIEHPEYVFYFIIVIIGFGAIGVWSSLYVEYYNKVYNHSNVISNLLSFSVAIIATGSIELMFVENKFIRKTLFLISVFIIFTSCILFLLSMKINSSNGYWIAIPFSLFSLYIWWIANADNANLTKNFFVEQSDASKILNSSLEDYE